MPLTQLISVALQFELNHVRCGLVAEPLIRPFYAGIIWFKFQTENILDLSSHGCSNINSSTWMNTLTYVPARIAMLRTSKLRSLIESCMWMCVRIRFFHTIFLLFIRHTLLAHTHMRWISGLMPKMIFCIHRDGPACNQFQFVPI